MILRILFLAVMLMPFAGRAYVWTSFNFTEVSPFDGLTRNVRMSIPDDYPYVRGILINFNASSGDTRAEYLQDYFTEFCRIHQFAFIGTEGFSQPSTNSNESALRAFTNSIASFATQSGSAEINNAPFVFHSVSGGVGPQYIVIRTNYSKVIAYSAGSGTFGDPPSIAATQILDIPGLLWAGDNDVSGMANKMESFIATNRPSGLRGSYAEMDLTTHAQSSLLHAAGIGFLNEMIQLSYPTTQCVLNGPITLTRLAESSGWLINSNTIRTVFETTTNYAAYVGSQSTAYWVPNKNMAYVHRAFATHLPPISLSVPVDETEVNPGANITITVNAASFTGWTNMAIYSYSTNIANFTSGTASFVMSNAVTGVYVFSAIGTRGGTNVVTKPIMVSVRKLTAPSYPCPGQIWYASTTGTAGGTGSIGSPWDLQTALNKTATIIPGDFLYLRGGNYTHVPQGTNCATCDQPGWIFKATISGTSGNQITIMSHPGEWAKIDGGAFVHFAANARPTIAVGQSGSTTIGAFLTFRNMEIYSSSTETRHSFDAGNETFPNDISRSEGFALYAPGAKVINCIIHDLTTGISTFGTASYNQEHYGNILYNCGWQGTPQRHGHNFYIQGPNSAQGFLNTVKRNIMAGAYKENAQIYGSSSSQVSHFRVSENILIGQQGVYGGFLLGTLDGGSPDRLQDNEVFGNFGYGADFKLYQDADPHAYHSVKAFGNYMVHSKLKVSSWKSLTLTNNTFITPVDVAFGNVSLKTTPSALGGNITSWNMDRNNYRFSAGFPSAFNWDGVANYTLAQWRSNTGYDLNSVLTTTGPSGTNYIIVQDNIYDPNRAHIAVYNWTSATHVAADLTALGWTAGDGVTIRNAQDYFLDIESGLVTSTNTIVLDMQAASHTVAVPFGAPSAIIPKHFPAFGAFVLERTSEVPPPATTNFTVIVTSFPNSAVPITFSPVDINGAGDGTTTFSRTNQANVVTTLTAPGTVDSIYTFSSWTRNGAFYSGSVSTTFTNVVDSQWQANYSTSKQTISVFSENPASGVFIQISPADDTGLSNGDTPFTREYVTGTTVTLTAPLASNDGNVFVHWKVGANPVTTSLTYNYNVTVLGPFTITAVYAPPSPPPGSSSSFSARRRGVRL